MVATITPSMLADLRRRGEKLTLIDVRTPAEFNRNPVGLPTQIAFSNFSEAWEKANFARYLLNTLIYTASSAAIFVITAVFLSVAADVLDRLGTHITREDVDPEIVARLREAVALIERRTAPRGGE